MVKNVSKQYYKKKDESVESVDHYKFLRPITESNGKLDKKVNERADITGKTIDSFEITVFRRGRDSNIYQSKSSYRRYTSYSYILMGNIDHNW